MKTVFQTVIGSTRANRAILLTAFLFCPSVSLLAQGGSSSTGSTGSAYKRRNTADVRDFGAKCDGLTDDTKAIQDAIDSLPLMRKNPQGQALRTGVIELPYVGNEGNSNGCLISKTLNIPPWVTFRAPGGQALLRTVPDFAPVLGSATVANVTYTPGTNIRVTAANNFSDGDTVVIQGVKGLVAANSYFGAHGPWKITSVTAAGFELADSSRYPTQPAYVSGGTIKKGVERFAVSFINANGDGKSPNDNFNVGMENVMIFEQARGNEFASGIFCNCSTGSIFTRVNVTAGYRGFVTSPLGTDNLTIESPIFAAAYFTDGPDPQALVVSGSTGTNTLNITNMKVVSDGPRQMFSADTPAVQFGGQITNSSLHGANFEIVGWPIQIEAFVQDIDLEEIVAVTDHVGPQGGGAADCQPFVYYPRVVQIDPAQTNLNSGIKIAGTYNCYGAGVLVGNSPAGSLPVPSGVTDKANYPLGYEDSITQFLRSGEIHASGLRNNAAPAGNGPFSKFVLDQDYGNRLYTVGSIGSYFPAGKSWSPTVSEVWTAIGAATGGMPQAAAYLRPGGGIMWPRENGTQGGSQCWGLYPGSAGADSNPGFEIWSYGSCTNYTNNRHLYERFSQLGEDKCAGDYHVCLDPAGTENVGVGGSLKVAGQSAVLPPDTTVGGTIPATSVSSGASCSGSAPHVTGVTASLVRGAITLTVTCGP